MRATDCTLVILTMFVLTGTPVMGNDNVVGLPKPRDPQKPGAVMLFGGGGITNDAWDKFIALAGGPQARIVIVPSAGYRSSDYDTDEEFRGVLSSRFSAWLRLPRNGRAANVEFLYTDNPKDAESDSFIRPLKTATGVWFSGGLQSRLYYRFVGYHPAQTKFQVALREVVERGGVVGGTSAGMAALPEVMTLYQDSSSGPVTAIPAHGLGLFNGAIVEQHFDGRNGRLERFTTLLRNEEQLDKLLGQPGAGAKTVGLAVDTSTGVVMQQDRLEVVGEGGVHIFIKADAATLTWHTLKSGTKAELKRERSGAIRLVK